MTARRALARLLLAALLPVTFGALGVSWSCATVASIRLAEPGCANGARDGDEEGIDCGGRCLGKCPDKDCAAPGECASGNCPVGKCVPPRCDDRIWNAQESDVDCGGAACPGCEQDKRCEGPCDCASGVCTGGRCQPDPTGGSIRCSVMPYCMQCDDGRRCNIDAECASLLCDLDSKTCRSCNDGARNGAETDADCGGAASGSGCGPCKSGGVCAADADCISGHCDGISRTCSPSDLGERCFTGVDCADTTASCVNGVCRFAPCLENSCMAVPECGKCDGDVCTAAVECWSNCCAGGTCCPLHCTNGTMDDDETGLDCGGSCPACPL